MEEVFEIKKKFSFFVTIILVFSLLCTPAFAAGKSLIPVGSAVGISVESDGVIVAGFSETGDSPAASAGLMPGDIIINFNGVDVSSCDDVKNLAQTLDGEPITITVKRGDITVSYTVTPLACDDGSWELGLWLRDSLTGIGTVTYYDPETGEYGALGHGINDSGSGVLIPIRSGNIAGAVVTDVQKGKCGTPGQLIGTFDFSEILGNIASNTNCGIFGKADRLNTEAAILETADSSEITTGSASIIACVDENGPCEYAVQIVRVYRGGGDMRDMMLKVTDERLLNITGGIVQGMSGSPIIQNGKLIGAVTHVLVNDPSRGYGVSIENMLNAA